ncbi:MAG: haloacid dehalogenase type II [Chloroflexi bacterium]|jgi:2-haloacid dehalogenase|nr:haloacid dehalogenase type II [Chloroflexota bacterium]
MDDLDLTRFDALTFDCYGTLIDWEAGILAGLRPVVARSGVDASDDALLETYARHESALEAGPYRTYREVLGLALREVGADLGAAVTDDDAAAFGGSVVDWPAFPDSAEALAALHARYRLGVLTNCDDDLFAGSSLRLGDPFDMVVTAQQVGAYKPSLRGFELVFERIGVPRERILHVAQSLFHDHVPAKQLGLATVWVDRRHGRHGSGATPPADATPDLVVPDMATLAALTAR